MKKNAVLSLFLVLMLFLCLVGPANAEEHSVGINSFNDIYKYIHDLHIDKPNSETLIRGAINGMIEELGDPYTEYIPPEDLEDFFSSIDGEYVGVGIQIEPGENYPKITGIIANTPASKADIKPGDLIVKVNGVDIANEPLSKIVQKIRGFEGTKVTITIRREGKNDVDIELVRASINTPTAEGKMLEGNICYIRINTFGSHTPHEFRKILATLVMRGAEKLVLDLRDNPGGLLQASVQICSNFVDTDKVVVSIIDRSGKKEDCLTEDKPYFKGMPVVILVNKGSASASEILTGALQDYGIATVIGDQTYGKGTVQSVITLKEGGALKLTIAEYYTPKERVISGKGLSPDIQVLTPGLVVPAALNFFNKPGETAVHMETGKTTATVNGSDVTLRQTALIRSEEIYLPLRFIFEALGYRVDWQPENGSIRVEGDNTDLLFYPGDRVITIGDNTLEGTLPVLNESGTNYIPVSDLPLVGISVKIDGGSITIKK